MPVVSVKKKDLLDALGESKMTDKQFDELCFEFGIELDDITSEKEMKSKMSTNKNEDKSQWSEEVIYKIEVPANRYDLLCLEGIARALRVFKGKESLPVYKTTKPTTKLIVKSSVKEIRPFVVSAILRDVKFTETSYQSFIELQDKLHQNICRQRKLVSIGTHDLNTISAPFSYEALPPKDIKFVPLTEKNNQIMNGIELIQHLETTHVAKYLPLITHSPVYPVIFDSKRRVLSLPPIINGDHSKMSKDTKDVLVEVTAIDETKASIVLDTMVTMFAEYSKDKFVVESVEVIYEEENRTVITPNFTPRTVSADIDYINQAIGINVKPQQVLEFLTRMSLDCSLGKNENTVDVKVPPTRSDIIHACDVMEDVAIAYGFNNLKFEIPSTITKGFVQPINKLTDLLRIELAMAGFTEALTLSLCSKEENFDFLNQEDDGSAVVIANPKTIEFQVARTNMLTGLLKTLAMNREKSLPIKLFEISDVVQCDDQSDVGAINKRVVSALYCDTSAGLSEIHGLLDIIMLALDIEFKFLPPEIKKRRAEKKKGKEEKSKKKKGKSNLKSVYELKPSKDKTFFEKLRADIIVDGKKQGVFGIVHPDVLKAFGIIYPVSAIHLYLDQFV